MKPISKALLIYVSCFFIVFISCNKGIKSPAPASSTSPALKFSGNWNVSEQGTLTPKIQYPISIQPADNDQSSVKITNLHNYFTTAVNAYVSGNTIFIPNQMCEGKILFGQGSMSVNGAGGTNTITISYQIIDTATVKTNSLQLVSY